MTSERGEISTANPFRKLEAKKNGAPEGAPLLCQSWPLASELELDANLHGPARLTAVVTQREIAKVGRTEVVAILLRGRVDTGEANDAEAAREADFLDLAPILVDQVADVQDVESDFTLAEAEEAR